MKTLLITGTGSGIGYECAKKFSTTFNVVGVSKSLGEFVNEVGDLTDPAFRDFIVSKYTPDVFINNAGIGGGPDRALILETNTVAAVDLLLKFYAKMSPGSDIVNISSFMGWRQGHGLNPNEIAYSTSKHALSFASQSLAFNKDKQVRVMTLEPQAVVSKQHGGKAASHPFRQMPPQEDYDNFTGTQQVPLPPQYVADTIEWMLSQPRWANVQTLRLTNNFVYRG